MLRAGFFVIPGYRTKAESVVERILHGIDLQQLLDEMNRRARLQLRLQETAEHFSVVAITYYGSQLIQYLAKGAKGRLPATPETITAVAIPVIAAAAAYSIHRLRQRLHVSLH